MMQRKTFFLSAMRSETGSNVAQASGVALFAAILISTILTMTPMLSSQVERAFICLAASLSGGGGGCGSGGGAAGSGAFQVTTASLPTLREPYDPPAGSRNLTPEERALAEQVFGPGAIDLDRVQISTDGIFLQPRAYVIGNTIYWPPSRQIDPSVLAHELTHVYQYQKRGWIYLDEALALQAQNELYTRWPDNWPNPFSSPYDYGGEDGLRQARSEGKSFADFNVEQQGKIVEDYYARVLAGNDTSVYDPYIRDARQGRLAPGQTPPLQPRGGFWNPPWSGDWLDFP